MRKDKGVANENPHFPLSHREPTAVLSPAQWRERPTTLPHRSLARYCDATDCNLPGSSVHRILQARILE